MRSFIPASAILFLCAMPVSAAYSDTLRYHNFKYGTEITFPMHLFTQRQDAPSDGSGMCWLGKNTSSLCVYTVANALVETPQQFGQRVAKSYLDQNIKIYLDTTGSRITVSGNENGKIFYMRYLFDNDDIIHSVIIRYPTDNRAIYEEYLKDIADSLSVKNN